MPSVRRLGAYDWSAYRKLRLRSLADFPDAFGSTFDRESAQSDVHWMQRLAAGAASPWDAPLAVEQPDQFVGLVWGRIDPSAPETAHVFQMWVAPEARGLGVGRMLLDSVVGWAREANARRVVLNVTCGDTPATRMYSRAGFKAVGSPEPLRPGAAVLAQLMQLDL
jgi:ribosomal protein S18 acetylase RimI-like enzyme